MTCSAAFSHQILAVFSRPLLAFFEMSSRAPWSVLSFVDKRVIKGNNDLLNKNLPLCDWKEIFKYYKYCSTNVTNLTCCVFHFLCICFLCVLNIICSENDYLLPHFQTYPRLWCDWFNLHHSVSTITSPALNKMVFFIRNRWYISYQTSVLKEVFAVALHNGTILIPRVCTFLLLLLKWWIC